MNRKMDFGESLKKEGWTLVTLSLNDAIKLNFDNRSEIKNWLDANIESQWQQVSFRRLAFKNSTCAILFKLSI